MLPPPDRLDPADAWKAWAPSAADPWGRKWAAHLYRRAGFGASRAELIEAEIRGHAGTLDLLMRGRPEAADVLPTLVDTGRIKAGSKDPDPLRAWWVYVISHGGHPLREKLTLFWHNHFATSVAKVSLPALMFAQNCTLREHALGKFGPLLQAVSRDPAMLVYLDSNSNVKGRPNENYAREVMELFSLGVGNYAEKDIREAARAFTGWHTDGTKYTFVSELHDDGPKTVLGRAGNLDGGDVVRIILDQPACARFLVRKLYAYLVSETPPPDALLEPLCDRFRKSDYDVAELVRTILASRLFYSDHAFRKRVKGPVEYVLGAVNAVYMRHPEDHPEYRPVPPAALIKPLTAMGQSLFAPPNVKGWPGGRTWLNTSTVLERDNFAAALATGTFWGSGDDPPAALDPARVLEEEKVSRPADVVKALLDLYVPGGVRPDAAAKLTDFLAGGDPTGPALARRAREVVHAILTMPEYQLA
jgi:uncharacterized protein (DUF1800 family)